LTDQHHQKLLHSFRSSGLELAVDSVAKVVMMYGNTRVEAIDEDEYLWSRKRRLQAIATATEQAVDIGDYPDLARR
jgi:hypothetical protein